MKRKRLEILYLVSICLVFILPTAVIIFMPGDFLGFKEDEWYTLVWGRGFHIHCI